MDRVTSTFSTSVSFGFRIVADALSMGGVAFFFFPMTSSSFPEAAIPAGADPFGPVALAVSTGEYPRGGRSTHGSVDFAGRGSQGCERTGESGEGAGEATGGGGLLRVG